MNINLVVCLLYIFKGCHRNRVALKLGTSSTGRQFNSASRLLSVVFLLEPVSSSAGQRVVHVEACRGYAHPGTTAALAKSNVNQVKK